MQFQTISLFIRYLTQLQGILDKLAREQREDIVDDALIDDMMPLSTQVKITCNFALRGTCPLMGQEVLRFDASEPGLVALKQQVSQTTEYLHQQLHLCQRERIHLPDVITDDAGEGKVALPPQEFIGHYILPNFFFHLSMVYAIARSQGVSLGKRDFDGFHRYSQSSAA